MFIDWIERRLKTVLRTTFHGVFIAVPWNEEREEGKTAAGHQKPKVEWENGAKHSPDSLKKLGT